MSNEPARPQPSPDRAPLGPDRLRQRLERLGFSDISVVERTGSTNTDLSARSGCPDGTVLIAEEQSAGRGRMGRTWTAPARSQIIVSVSVTCPGLPGERLGLVPLLAGLAITQGIIDATGVEAALKWPNDVLVDGRKLVGVLVEVPEIQPVPRIVIGFGVNYDLTQEELPVPHATSLALEMHNTSTGKVAALPSREDVVASILMRLKEDLERFRAMGGAPMTFMNRYKQLSATLGSPVKVMLPGERELCGTATDLTDSGELVVRQETGELYTVAAGDVVHVRAADGNYGK